MIDDKETDMTDVYTTALWIPKAGQEEVFMDAWEGFATWARTMPGAGTLRLARDLDDATRFTSFGRWDSFEAAHQWKSSGDFRDQMAKVQEHVEKFQPAELQIVRTVSDEQSS